MSDDERTSRTELTSETDISSPMSSDGESHTSERALPGGDLRSRRTSPDAAGSQLDTEEHETFETNHGNEQHSTTDRYPLIPDTAESTQPTARLTVWESIDWRWEDWVDKLPTSGAQVVCHGASAAFVLTRYGFLDSLTDTILSIRDLATASDASSVMASAMSHGATAFTCYTVSRALARLRARADRVSRPSLPEDRYPMDKSESTAEEKLAIGILLESRSLALGLEYYRNTH